MDATASANESATQNASNVSPAITAFSAIVAWSSVASAPRAVLPVVVVVGKGAWDGVRTSRSVDWPPASHNAFVASAINRERLGRLRKRTWSMTQPARISTRLPVPAAIPIIRKLESAIVNPPSPVPCPCRATRCKPHRFPGARRATARMPRLPVPPACPIHPRHRGSRRRAPMRGRKSRLRRS